MGFSESFKLDFTFKRVQDKTLTSTDKAYYEEAYPSSDIIHVSEIWSDNIPTTPPTGTTSVVEVHTDFKLTEDVTVGGKQAWVACTTPGNLNTRVGDFISWKFGNGYTVQLFEDDGAGNIGTQVPFTDAINWIFDYRAGTVAIENSHTKTTPFHIKAYRYVGTTGVSGTGVAGWKSGKQTIPSGADQQLISFATAYSHEDYNISVTITNDIDSPPSVYGYLISSITTSGFEVIFSGEMDTGNYVIHWNTSE